MILKDCFGSRHGIGVLSTADAEGRVDATVEAIAVVGRPRVENEGAVHVGGFPRVTTWRPGP